MDMGKRKGVNQRSLENLQPGGEARYGLPKRPRNVSATDIGWAGLKQIADERGISLAELFERLGRGILRLQDGEFNQEEEEDRVAA